MSARGAHAIGFACAAWMSSSVDVHACPCSEIERTRPALTAPEPDEIAPTDAHVWLWFSSRFRGLSATGPARSPAALRYTAIVGPRREVITLRALEHRTRTSVVTELAREGTWPVDAEVSVQASEEPHTAPVPLLTFRTGKALSIRARWSGVDRVDVDDVGVEAAACGEGGALLTATLAEPAEAQARPLLFVWRGPAGDERSRPPDAIERLRDEIVELEAGDCPTAALPEHGASLITVAVGLDGRASAAQRSSPIARSEVSSPSVALPLPAEDLGPSAVTSTRRGTPPWAYVGIGAVVVAGIVATRRRTIAP